MNIIFCQNNKKRVREKQLEGVSEPRQFSDSEGDLVLPEVLLVLRCQRPVNQPAWCAVVVLLCVQRSSLRANQPCSLTVALPVAVRLFFTDWQVG